MTGSENREGELAKKMRAVLLALAWHTKPNILKIKFSDSAEEGRSTRNERFFFGNVPETSIQARSQELPIPERKEPRSPRRTMITLNSLDIVGADGETGMAPAVCC